MQALAWLYWLRPSQLAYKTCTELDSYCSQPRKRLPPMAIKQTYVRTVNQSSCLGGVGGEEAKREPLGL